MVFRSYEVELLQMVFNDCAVEKLEEELSSLVQTRKVYLVISRHSGIYKYELLRSIWHFWKYIDSEYLLFIDCSSIDGGFLTKLKDKAFISELLCQMKSNEYYRSKFESMLTDVSML